VLVVGGASIEGDATRRGLRILGWVLAGAAVVWLFAFFLRLRREGWMPGSIKARADLEAIVDAIAWFAQKNDGRLPEELSVLWKPDSRGHRYLDVYEPPLDPWDNPYHYEPSPDAASFRVFSLGEDGRPGGEGEDADLEIVRAR